MEGKTYRFLDLPRYSFTGKTPCLSGDSRTLKTILSQDCVLGLARVSRYWGLFEKVGRQK